MTSQNTHTSFELFMDSDGNLYHEPRETHIYPLNASHHAIVSLLAKSKNFIQFEEISNTLNKELSHNTIKQIVKEINKNAQDRLSLAKDLILHKNGAGYKINKKYKITLLNA